MSKLSEIIPEAFTAFSNRQLYTAGRVVIRSLDAGRFILSYKDKPIVCLYPNGVLAISAPNTTQGILDILSYVCRSSMCNGNCSLLFAGSEIYLNGRLWDGYWKVVGMGETSAEYANVHNIKTTKYL